MLSHNPNCLKVGFISFQKLSNLLNQEGVLSLSSDATRSQLANKDNVTKRFFELLNKALLPEKERKKNKILESVQLERLKAKKMKAERKAERNIRNDFLE